MHWEIEGQYSPNDLREGGMHKGRMCSLVCDVFHKRPSMLLGVRRLASCTLVICE